MDRKIEKKKWPPKKIATVAGGSLFAIIILYSLIFGDRSSKLNVNTERITISEVRQGPFQEFIPIIGNVLPIETFQLSSSEGGRVETRYIESGTPVKQGDPIILLSNTDLLLTIMWREAEMYSAENNLRSTRLMMEQNALQIRSQLNDLRYNIGLQKRTYERSQKLREKNLISAEEFEQARDQYHYSLKRLELTTQSMQQDSMFRANQVATLETNLQRMRSNLDIVRQKQDNLTVRAPISGVLTSLNAEIGETKVSGATFGQIDVLDHFKVRAGIDEHYLPRIEVDRVGTFTLAGETYRLNVERIYMEVRDGRFEVDMFFEGTEPDGIRRGQTLHIRLELGDQEEAILLPAGGFYQSTGGQWVYVVDESGSFAVKRRIKINRFNPQVYEVTEGLQPGEQVITSSYDNFGDIDKLILKD